MTENLIPYTFPDLTRSTEKKVLGPRHDSAAGSGASLLGELRRNAEQKGYEDGYQAGERASRSEVEAAWADRLAQAEAERAGLATLGAALADAVGQLRRADALAVDEAAKQAIELAYRLAETIVEHDVSREDGVLDAIQRACALLPVREGVTLHVHPTQLAQVREVVGDDPAVEVIPDSNVRVGGCIAEAGTARVDMRWETALAKVRSQLGLAPL